MNIVTSRSVKGRSLRTTYLFLAFGISAVLLSGSLIATYYINVLNSESTESIQIRNTAAESIHIIRDHLWWTETSLNTVYISQTTADKQALLDHLDQANKELSKLAQLKTRESSSLDIPIAALQENINDFKVKIQELVEKSEDPNWVYPILPYISDTLLTSNQEFSTAVTIVQDELTNETPTAHLNNVYREITELRDLWRRQILDFRAIVIRVVGLNQRTNLTQAANIKLRHEVIQEKIDSIRTLFGKDPFGFDTENAITAMQKHANQWFSDYLSFERILATNIWRSDIQFIKTEILPVQQQAAHNLTNMEQITGNWSTENVNRVNAATRLIIYELWGLALVAFLFVGLIYNILSRTLLKPIVQLSEELTRDIHNSDTAPLTSHGKGILFTSLEVHSLVDSYNDMKQIIQARDNELNLINQSLEKQVKIRTAELEAIIGELKTFNYSVSHDLRSPLRSIDGFSLALMEDYEDKLDDTARDYLNRIRNSAQRMGELIDDMLDLSSVSRKDIKRETIDLSKIATHVLEVLKQQQPHRQTEILVEPNITANGDKQLLQIVLENLIGNAWKYTNKKKRAQIQFGMTHHSDRNVYYIKDNGTGFNMQYVNKLFGVFQRLHGNEYEGTGIGLATVKRIIERHGGEVWAQSKENKGATFYFTLG